MRPYHSDAASQTENVASGAGGGGGSGGQVGDEEAKRDTSRDKRISLLHATLVEVR